MARPRRESQQERLEQRRVAREARERERLAAEEKERLTREALAGGKKNARNPDEAIRRLFRGERSASDARATWLQLIEDERETTRAELLPGMERLLVHVSREADLLDPRRAETPEFTGALLSAAFHQGSWVRQPEAWKPPTHNARRQLQSLLRHLFARYPVPAFFDSVWSEGRGVEARRHQCWYIHVGAGNNIRTADVPIALTRAMAHHFLEAPADSSVLGALRWGQVRALGGSERLARAVGARLGGSFDHDDFWLTVIQFFVTHPMLDPAHMGPVCDWLHAQKLAEFAPEPELTMRGRTPETLLRRVQQWHLALNRHRYVAKSEWKRSTIPDFHYVEVRDDAKRTWEAVELLTAAELDEEGKAMHHCVGTYTNSCASGRVAIWSLRRYDPTGRWRILTVEIDVRAKRIMQARGITNRVADSQGLEILRRWATEAKLTLGSYL